MIIRIWFRKHQLLQMNGHALIHFQGLERNVGKENKREIQNKTLVSAWNGTSNPWISSRTPNPLGHQNSCSDKLKLFRYPVMNHR